MMDEKVQLGWTKEQLRIRSTIRIETFTQNSKFEIRHAPDRVPLQILARDSAFRQSSENVTLYIYAEGEGG